MCTACVTEANDIVNLGGESQVNGKSRHWIKWSPKGRVSRGYLEHRKCLEDDILRIAQHFEVQSKLAKDNIQHHQMICDIQSLLESCVDLHPGKTRVSSQEDAHAKQNASTCGLKLAVRQSLSSFGNSDGQHVHMPFRGHALLNGPPSKYVAVQKL